LTYLIIYNNLGKNKGGMAMKEKLLALYNNGWKYSGGSRRETQIGVVALAIILEFANPESYVTWTKSAIEITRNMREASLPENLIEKVFSMMMCPT
jgi:hypothetical protein